jgi:hypothetical protein
MKIFFVGSPRALKEHKNELTKIYHTITQLGHENLYHLVINSNPDTFYNKNETQINFHFKTTSQALHAADLLIVEASIHSLSMGYLVRMGEELDKPVIVMYKSGSEPFFFSGNTYERLLLVEYTLESIKENLTQALSYASDLLDTRFNLFLSPQMNSYLKWITKRNRTNRSTYIRQLLQNEIKQHPEFQANQ